MRKAFRYRIYPTRSQIGLLENTFSMCRHLYNWSLAERREAYEQRKETVTYRQQQNDLPGLKQARPWFKSVYSQVLQDVLSRLDKAYQVFLRGERGYPKFKKRGQWSSITYPQFTTRPLDGKLRVPKLDEIEIVYHRPIPDEAKVKTLTIIKEGGKWFACFSVELPAPPEPKSGHHHAVGLDLGLEKFVTFDDGTCIGFPRHLPKLSKQIKRVQRRLSRQKKRTPEYLADLRILQKLWYRVRCARQDFVHKVANAVLAKGDCIIHEDLSIQRMLARPKPQQDGDARGYLPNGAAFQARLHSSIADACWGQFLRILRYKAIALGKRVVAVEPAYTSQMCSSCGTLVPKSLSTRTHACSTCGYTADRDLNAAKNICRLGLQSAGLMTQEAPAIASA